MGYLAQNTGLETSLTIWDEMLTVFTHLQQMETKLRRLEQEMGKEENFSNAAIYEKLLADYDQLQLDYKDQGGYQYEADIRSILSGLGFPFETLSDENFHIKWWTKDSISSWEIIIN